MVAKPKVRPLVPTKGHNDGYDDDDDGDGDDGGDDGGWLLNPRSDQ